MGESVVVVGAGPVGCVLAALLARRGYQVAAYEKRSDMRLEKGAAGRSINLVLTARGMRGLAALGLEQRALELTVPVLGRMMHSVEGELAYQPYGKDDSEHNLSVSRGELNQFLLDEAERAGVTLHFEHCLTAADYERGTLTFATPAGDVGLAARHVFGSDGAPSAVRGALIDHVEGEVSMDLLSHGYKELVFKAGPDGAYAIDGRALHIWPRGEHMLMGLANLDGSFTGTVYLPMEGPDSFAALDDEAKVLAFFQRHYPDAIPLIDDLGPTFLSNPTGVLGTVRRRPWHFDDRVLLVGDAAHAIVPFFGQGLNCGLEDCAVLSALLDEHGSELGRVFSEFDRLRKRNGDAIADMALENFVEMRDRVGDPQFLLRKQVEHLLENRFPTKFRSRYAMVVYSAIPYADAQAAGRIHDELLSELCGGLNQADQVDLERAESLLDTRLEPFLRERGIDLAF